MSLFFLAPALCCFQKALLKVSAFRLKTLGIWKQRVGRTQIIPHLSVLLSLGLLSCLLVPWQRMFLAEPFQGSPLKMLFPFWFQSYRKVKSHCPKFQGADQFSLLNWYFCHLSKAWNMMWSAHNLAAFLLLGEFHQNRILTKPPRARGSLVAQLVKNLPAM